MNQLSDLDLGFAGNLTHLNCSKNNLSELVINSTELQEVDCSYNQLQRLEIADPAKLFSLDCSYNRLTFATLPILETYTIYNYLYQDIIIIGNDGKLYVHEEVDFSAEAVIDGVRTEFRWYGVGGPVSPTTENNGNFTFGYNFIGELIYCEFTNNKFPGLVLDTTEVRVLPPAPGQKSR
jgi:Leucine-rich repeat (LRR) protein